MITSWMLPLLAAAAAPGDLYSIQQFFSPETLFNGLPQIAAKFRNQYFDILAFLILAAAGVRGWLASPQDKLMGLVPAAIFGLFVAIIPMALNTIDGGVLSIVSQSGMTDPNTIFSRLVNLSDPFEPSNSGEQANLNALKQAGTPEQLAQVQTQQHTFWGIDISRAVAFLQDVGRNVGDAANATVNKVKAAANFANDPVGGVGDALRYVFFKIVSIISAALIWVILQGCGIVVYVIITVRYLLIHLESVVLPVFIAMMATQRLGGQGNNYVMGLVGILFWPLGWALGHLGTLAICGWFQALIAGILQVPGDPNPGYVFNLVVNGPVGAAPAPSPQAMCVAMLIALVGVLIIGIYVLVVTLSAPFIIARALKSGSGIFGEMVGGAGKGAAGLGAAAAGLAALAMTGGGAAAAAATGSAAAAGNGAAASGGGPPPIGADAAAALTNGSSGSRPGGGIGGGGGSSRSLASRATTRAPAGTGGIYAAGTGGDVAYIPMAQEEMAAAFSGGGGGSSGGGGGGNGGGGSSGGGGGGNGGGGGSSGGSGGGGKAGGGKGKSAKVSGSSARAYRAVMAMGALQGALEAASQWDGGADVVAHTATRSASGASNQYDRARRMDRQDFDPEQEKDDDKKS